MSSVSVVIPCYNAEAFIGETIESVLRQTRAVDEVIVVDDGSRDSSAEIAESFGDPVRVVRQENRGECGARNRGVKEARGEIIAFLDADDLWHPEKIERQLAYFDEHPGVGAVTTSASAFQAGGREWVYLEVEDRKIRELRPLDFLAFHWVNQSAIAVKSELLRFVPYPEGITDSGDMIQVALLRTKTEIGAVEEPLALYRQHDRQVTCTFDHYARSVRFRVEWASENYQLVGAASPAQAALAVLLPAVEKTLALYWARDISQFKRRRAELLQLWPAGEAPPPDLTRFVAPRFVLRVRDAVGKLMG